MECHHIVQPKDGGVDTFENCIPLCFDCHAEVGHYNKEHPKGTKFTPEELRQHRDRWFKKIEAGVSRNAPEHHRDLDNGPFQRVIALLGGSREMTHFRDHDYGAIYPIAIDQRLAEFLAAIGLPEAEFFDLNIESASANLKHAVEEYNEARLQTVWRHDLQDSYGGIPRERRDGDAEARQRFRDAVKPMNKKGDGGVGRLLPVH